VPQPLSLAIHPADRQGRVQKAWCTLHRVKWVGRSSREVLFPPGDAVRGVRWFWGQTAGLSVFSRVCILMKQAILTYPTGEQPSIPALQRCSNARTPVLPYTLSLCPGVHLSLVGYN
jgi:hypothetical protein